MSTRLVALMATTVLCAAVAAACSPKTPAEPAAKAQAAKPADGVLKQAGGVDIPGYKGDFDHFAIDEKGDRLFLAGEEGKTLEVFKLSTGERIKTLTDQVEVPHSLFYMPASDELLILDGGPGGPRVLDGKTYAVKRHYKMPELGSDSIGYDAKANRLWVVSGGKDVPLPYSYLTEIDPGTGKIFHNIKFDADHVEAMAIDPASDRLWISVTDKNKTAIVDRKAGKIIGEWPVTAAQQNAPMTFDPVTRRLFIVTRKPGMLLVVNADTGATVASFKAPERTDQVVWDPINRRVYVTGGEGYIGVIQQDDADHYSEAGHVPSAPGAKTAILTPDAKRLYVAASPGESGAMGKVIWYDVAPRS
jgi:sugar lactone lactonase YvrE